MAFKSKSSLFQCKSWKLWLESVTGAGVGLEAGAAVCPGRFHVCMLTARKTLNTSRSCLMQQGNDYWRMWRVCDGFSALQPAADAQAVVQEVEAALQLLQKRVLFVECSFAMNSENENKSNFPGICLQLHLTLVHVVVWSSNHQQDKWVFWIWDIKNRAKYLRSYIYSFIFFIDWNPVSWRFSGR